MSKEQAKENESTRVSDELQKAKIQLQELRERNSELERTNELLQNKVKFQEDYKPDPVKFDQKNITEKKDFFSVVEEVARIGSFEWDVLNNVVFWSDGLCKIYGIKPEDFDGKLETVMAFMHPDDVARVNEEIAEMIASRKFHLFEHRIIRADRVVRFIQGNNKFYFDDKDNLIRIIGTNIDITSQKEADARLHLALEESEKANRAKANFLSVMCHELRTPLNGIMGMADVLSMNQPDKEVQFRISIIKRSGEALLKIIESIMIVGKIERDLFHVHPEAFDLKMLIRRMIDLNLPGAHGKGLEVRCRIDDKLPDSFVSDPYLVEQILSNLIANAVKFTQEGWIGLEIRYNPGNPGRIVMQIEDTGIGIEMEKLERIFQRFFMIDDSSTRPYGGIGMGLSIVKELTGKLGGFVRVESQIGQGSNFLVELPQLEQVEKPKKLSLKPRPQAINRRILVIEDDLTNQLFMKTILDRVDCSYDIVKNGIEAVKAIQEKQ